MDAQRLEAIKNQAKFELEQEKFREAVEAKKVELRKTKTLWEIIFPFKITISRR